MKINTKPRSDQWNADDFLAGERTFTIASVGEGKAEGNHDIELVEGEGRVWRPPLTVLRILEAAWGDDGDAWVGKRVTLYRDPEVRMGRDVTGGIRVSHMSGISRALTVKVQTSRGKRTDFTIQPLPDAPARPADPSEADIAACTDEASLKALWDSSSKSPAVMALVTARKAEIVAGGAS